MTLEQLATLVKSMRDAQKEYFKTKNREALIASKVNERLVDEAVEAILK